MADDVDYAQNLAEMENMGLVNSALEAAAKIPVGESGICKSCEEYSKRLVNERCAPCRDGI